GDGDCPLAVAPRFLRAPRRDLGPREARARGQERSGFECRRLLAELLESPLDDLPRLRLPLLACERKRVPRPEQRAVRPHPPERVPVPQPFCELERLRVRAPSIVGT